MKVKAGAYPEEKNWTKWIKFNNGPAINRVFLYRLAAYVRDVIKVQTVIDVGERSMKDQQVVYDLYIAGKGNVAAKPGLSWHNYQLAVDFNRIRTINGKGVYPGTLDADYLAFTAGRPETLNKYGLIHAATGEPWHIQPIETKRFTGERCWFADADDYVNTGSGRPMLQLTSPLTKGNFVMELQKAIGSDADGAFGTDTDADAKKYQASKKLTADGIVGEDTWTAVLATVPAPDYKALYQKELSNNAVLASQKKALQDQITVLQSKIADAVSVLK